MPSENMMNSNERVEGEPFYLYSILIATVIGVAAVSLPFAVAKTAYDIAKQTLKNHW